MLRHFALVACGVIGSLGSVSAQGWVQQEQSMTPQGVYGVPVYQEPQRNTVQQITPATPNTPYNAGTSPQPRVKIDDLTTGRRLCLVNGRQTMCDFRITKKRRSLLPQSGGLRLLLRSQPHASPLHHHDIARRPPQQRVFLYLCSERRLRGLVLLRLGRLQFPSGECHAPNVSVVGRNGLLTTRHGLADKYRQAKRSLTRVLANQCT